MKGFLTSFPRKKNGESRDKAPEQLFPELAASAIKHGATERAAEPTLPITAASPCARLASASLGPPAHPCTPLVPSATCLPLGGFGMG